tara:strand:+ start:988 stop:1392 length:405 start_codon:yes stop_codon:yes gene_type:complete
MTEKNQQEQQEILFKLSMFEQQVQQLQQQLQAVEQGIVELNSLSLGLDGLDGKKGKEILAPIGKGIFAKAKLLSEELIVNIGDKTFVKKNISETKKIIEKQIEKLEEVKKELDKNLENVNGELRGLIKSVDNVQ